MSSEARLRCRGSGFPEGDARRKTSPGTGIPLGEAPSPLRLPLIPAIQAASRRMRSEIRSELFLSPPTGGTSHSRPRRAVPDMRRAAPWHGELPARRMLHVPPLVPGPTIQISPGLEAANKCVGGRPPREPHADGLPVDRQEVTRSPLACRDGSWDHQGPLPRRTLPCVIGRYALPCGDHHLHDLAASSPTCDVPKDGGR
jgi:hypothetical protein